MSQFDSDGTNAEGSTRTVLLRCSAKESPIAASPGGARTCRQLEGSWCGFSTTRETPGPSEDRSHRYGPNIQSSQAKHVPRCTRCACPDSTGVLQIERTPHHRTASLSKPPERSCRPGSTHAAECDPAQNVLHRPRPQFAVNHFERDVATERPVGPLQPPGGGCLISDVPLRERNNACQAIQAIGLVAGQAPLVPAPLQAARRKIQGRREFLERQARRNSSRFLTTFCGKPSRIADRRSLSVRIARPRTFSPPNSAITAWRSSAILASIIAPDGT